MHEEHTFILLLLFYIADDVLFTSLLVVLVTTKSLNIPQCALIFMFKNMVLSHQQKEDALKSVFNIISFFPISFA